MKIEETKAIIESILFAAGRKVTISEFANILEKTPEEIESVIENLTEELNY